MRMKVNSATVRDMGSRMKREDHGVNLRLRFGVKEGSLDRENVLSKQSCSNREMRILSSKITLMVLLLRAYPKHENQRGYCGIYPNTSSSLSGLQN
jgi:hypothetical protein